MELQSLACWRVSEHELVEMSMLLLLHSWCGSFHAIAPSRACTRAQSFLQGAQKIFLRLPGCGVQGLQLPVHSSAGEAGPARQGASCDGFGVEGLGVAPCRVADRCPHAVWTAGGGPREDQSGRREAQGPGCCERPGGRRRLQPSFSLLGASLDAVSFMSGPESTADLTGRSVRAPGHGEGHVIML